MIQNTDTIRYSGLKRWSGETYYHYLARCRDKARKKLKEEGFVQTITLAQTDDIGWAATFLKAPFKCWKNRDYIIEGVRLADNSSTKAPVFYYRTDDALKAMRLISTRFNKGSSLKEVCDYLISSDFIDAFKEE